MAASLTNALSSLRTSTTTLSSSLAILDTGIADLPRLSKVLTQTRHFELLPASTLTDAQTTLISEITPEVEALLARVEAEVEKLERREQGLRARWELQEGRLGREPRSARSSGSAGASASAAKKDKDKEREKAPRKSLGARQEAKARLVRQKKERLSYAVERLTLQAQQTERQLRKSMAVQEASGAERKGGAEAEEDDLEFWQG